MNKEMVLKFKNDNLVVNCRTLKEAKDFFETLKANGITRWYNGNKIDSANTYWGMIKEKTCYTYDLNIKGFCYGNYDFFVDKSRSKEYDVRRYSNID